MSRKSLFISLIIVILFTGACNTNATHQDAGNETPAGDYIPPPPGAVMATDEIPIKDANARLNHFNFSIKIIATSYSKSGTYDIEAAWGPSTAKGSFTMPQGGSNLKPLLKRGTAPYTYIIGFHTGNDKTFYEYYQVSAAGGNIEMKYLKGYSFK